MNRHQTEEKLYLLRRKEKLAKQIEDAQHSLERAKSEKGYGNQVWEAHFEDRVLILKQRLYETNLALDSYVIH